MPDSQSSEPVFESLFATVSKIGHFRSLHWRPCSLSCINEYLAIGSGGNVSDLALTRNCCLARMLPGEAELVSEWTGLPGEAKSVKRFERSNGLDTALYKKDLYLLPHSPVWPKGASQLRNHEHENLDLLHTMTTLDCPWTYELPSVSARGTSYPWANRCVTSSCRNYHHYGLHPASLLP